MRKAVVIPTGDEVKSGLVLDTNSPAIIGIILEKYPLAVVVRAEPVNDEISEINRAISLYLDCDLIILIGGSGGGRLYDPSLAPDVTYTVMEKMLEDSAIKDIYGYNGHLWSRLVIGRLKNTVVANVPGPFVEAVAAARAIVGGLADGGNLRSVLGRVAQAVREQYPAGGEIV